MKKIVFQIHELYHKPMHGNPRVVEVAYSKMPALDTHNKPIEYVTYAEAEGWIDEHYATSKGSSKEFQIEKIFKPA